MPRLTSRFGWDSCVFIAVLEGETGSASDTAALREVVDAADRGQVHILTSAIATTEVIGDLDNPDIVRMFDELFRRPNFTNVLPSPAIYMRARELRMEARRQSGRSLKTPDSLQVATAIATRCDAFHTYDERLLALSQSGLVDGLVICKPRGEQTVLGL